MSRRRFSQDLVRRTIIQPPLLLQLFCRRLAAERLGVHQQHRFARAQNVPELRKEWVEQRERHVAEVETEEAAVERNARRRGRAS